MLFADIGVWTGREPPRGSRKLRHAWTLTLCTTGALLCAPAALAADANDLSDAQTRYQHERALCINGQSHQDRATCLHEASAALDEAKRGHLNDGDASYEQNRLIRCNVHPPGEREDCQRMMHGEGTTRGSAAEGGIYRELVTTVVTPPGNSTQDSSSPVDPADRPNLPGR